MPAFSSSMAFSTVNKSPLVVKAIIDFGSSFLTCFVNLASLSSNSGSLKKHKKLYQKILYLLIV